MEKQINSYQVQPHFLATLIQEIYIKTKLYIIRPYWELHESKFGPLRLRRRLLCQCIPLGGSKESDPFLSGWQLCQAVILPS